MPQNIEIEFKNLLTKEEFQKLQVFFHINDQDFTKQVNYYFDTPDFLLKEKQSALRIREKNNQFQLTLKQPNEIGLLETNQALSKEEAHALLKTGTFPDGPVQTILTDLQIDSNHLTNFGTLTTIRAETEYEGGLIVLDHSYYLNSDDYELEYEVSNIDSGKYIFEQLLKTQQIPVRKTHNKIYRLLQLLKQQH